MNKSKVLFSTNCYHKDWEFLAQGGFADKMLLNDYSFETTLMLINNVDNENDVCFAFADLADLIFVTEDIADEALKYFGLDRQSFVDQKTKVDGYIYSIDSIVDLYLADGYDYIVHYCGDVELARKSDWITEGIRKIEEEGYLAARPGLPKYLITPKEELEMTETQTFSDHAYLISVKTLEENMKQIFALKEPLVDNIHVEYGGESFERKMTRFLHATGNKMAVINTAREVHPCYP